MERIYINNLNEMATQIGTFDRAVEVPLFYGNKMNPLEIDRFKGIYNMQEDRLSTVTSKNYTIIQHNDVLQAVVETLGGLNLNVKGLLVNSNDKMRCDLVFHENGTPIRDDADGIQLGIRVMNSYNKTSSFRLEMFAYRLVCENGMAFGKNFGVQEITFHVGEKNFDTIKEVTEKFIKNVINNSAKLQRYVNECMADSIEWDLGMKILEKLMPQTKHRKEIEKRLTGKEGMMNRWDLYNALTNYATHDRNLAPTAELIMELRSKKVFEQSFENLAKKMVTVKVTN